ncbi:MAG: sigma-70 family RNA polymerase sigma factor [Planctomycetes bacterium]|nr:sigma-70 family RNA polymerase sigma factor [Planctomycetota bacterium]
MLSSDPEIYAVLRELAGHIMARAGRDHTLQPTALVHEAWMKVGDNDSRWNDRSHFLRTASRAMRQVLVDHARARTTLKRSALGIQVPLQEVICNPTEYADEVLWLEEAVQGLTELDAELGQIVDLRFYAGLTLEETGDVMNISRQKVERRWRTARAWLADRLAPDK